MKTLDILFISRFFSEYRKFKRVFQEQNQKARLFYASGKTDGTIIAMDNNFVNPIIIVEESESEAKVSLEEKFPGCVRIIKSQDLKTGENIQKFIEENIN